MLFCAALPCVADGATAPADTTVLGLFPNAGFWLLAGLLVVWACCIVAVRRRRIRTAGMTGRWLGYLRAWRAAAHTTPDDLRLASSIQLTTSVSAHAIEWKGRQCLIACNEHSIVMLDSMLAEDSTT